jgi:Fe-Mn family superoxide dismutase
VHGRIELKYPIAGGLGEFLPPAALKVVAVDFQEGLLSRLNEEVKGTCSPFLFISFRDIYSLCAGTKWESETVAKTVIETSSERGYTLAFNYASQALNNSFFLGNLVCIDGLSPYTVSE